MRHLAVLPGLLFSLAFTPLLGQDTNPLANDAPLNLGFDAITLDANPPSGSGCCLDVLALGDIDGDGKVDVAVGAEDDGGLYWYRNTAGWPRYKIGSGNYSTDGRLVDINGDNRLDFVVSSTDKDELQWWENKGNPTAASGWVRHSIGGQYAHDVLVGDLSGDGKPDVVMFRKSNPTQVTWFEQPDPSQGRREWPGHEIAFGLKGEGLALGDTDGDGDLDVVASHSLYTNEGKGQRWKKLELPSICSDGVKEDIRPAIADINRDGKADIVLGPAEACIGPVAWFEGPNWKRRDIALGDVGELKGNHTLEIADLDRDGQPDLLLGEMHTGSKRVMVYQNLNKGAGWKRTVLSNQGTHNARIADLNGDGYPDIVGKNYDGPKKLEAWISRAPATLAPDQAMLAVDKTVLPLDKWTYKQVDDRRERLKGDFAFVGVAFGDINRDGFVDIASGKYSYQNPGGNLMGNWARTTFPVNADAVAMTDVDGDGQADVLALHLPKLYWLKPGAKGENWTVKEVGAGFEPTAHVNGQGYALAQIRVGGKPELVLSTGEGLWYVEIPANPNNPWPKVQITAEATTEDVLAVGDVDRDGNIDVIGSLSPKGRELVWFKNPGHGKGNWAKHPLGSTELWADRSMLEDLNGDGRPDLIVTEENGEDAGAATYWFENPISPTKPWTRHLIASQGSTNSLGVVDMDGDGDNDVVTAEHRGKKRLIIWENQGSALRWVAHQVDAGKESHLGARVIDLDNDGDLDLVSIAWDHAEVMHLWRNDAR